MGHLIVCGGASETMRFQIPPAPIGSELWNQWDEQLGSNHIARLIQKGLERLDLIPLRMSYSGRGSPPCPPELMLAMVLVEKYAGHSSPSEWHRHQSENMALMWIGQGIRPARGVWYQFRDRIGPFLDHWQSQILRIAEEMNITSATRGVVDGTLIAASASRHRLLNDKHLIARVQQLDEAIRFDEQKMPLQSQCQWIAKTPRGRRQQRGRCLRARELSLKQIRLSRQRRECISRLSQYH